MKKKRLISIVIIAAFATSLLAVPISSGNFKSLEQFAVSDIKLAVADEDNDDDDGNDGRTHDIKLEAVEMPDGMFAYRMAEHKVDGKDITDLYSSKPSIPGPTIVLRLGDEADVTLINKVTCDNFPDEFTTGRETPSLAKIGVHVHGVHYDIESDGTPQSVHMNPIGDEAAPCDDGTPGTNTFTYHWSAAKGTEGTWPYHDHTFTGEFGGEAIGLFGTVIVNPKEVKALVDGKVKAVNIKDIKKEYVLWMTSTEVLGKSLFYGMEIDNDQKVMGERGKQTPLWINPILIGTEGDLVRFHVLGMGDEIHSFHLHAHRWIEPGSDSMAMGKFSHIIDTEEIAPLDMHVFVIKAGEGVGPGDWMYHCHVFRHMEEGMSGSFRVLPKGTDDTIPPVGAVFTITDEPGLWFKTIDKGILEALDPREGIGFAIDFIESNTRSFALISPGETVLFNMKDSVTLHTVTSLIWPTGAARGSDSFPMDNQLMLRGSSYIRDNAGVPVPLTTEGLYVFVCQIHPYMFGAVIVDDDPIEGGKVVLDLAPSLDILTRTAAIPDITDPDSTIPGLSITTTPSLSALSTTLLTTFFVVTDPMNWKDYTDTMDYVPGDGNWNIRLPGTMATPVFVKGSADGVNLAPPVDLAALEADPPLEATVAGLPGDVEGEVWVNTQFELTLNKIESKRESLKPADASPLDKPGTITVVDSSGIDRKIALPGISMNNPHNMWADKDEEVIYQTQWFDRRLVAIDRDTGEVIKDLVVGQSPSHVITSPETDMIYVALNGEEQILEIDPLTLEPLRQISTGVDSHPHGHWISTDGRFIVTPNFFFPVWDSTLIDLSTDPPTIEKRETGEAPIATGMHPDGEKYYSADFLGNSLTCISVDLSSPACGENGSTAYKRIDLLTTDIASCPASGCAAGLPIQTPVSPDGKWVVTANVLFSKITVVDTSTDEVVAVLPCDPGCHGVNWGETTVAGKFYAYVTNKFSNAMIVVNPDPNGDMDGSDAVIVSRVLLVDSSSADKDDRIVGLDGMGGQGVLPLPIAYPGWS